MAAQNPEPTGIRGLVELLVAQVRELARLYATAARQELEVSVTHLKVGAVLIGLAVGLLAMGAVVLVILVVTAISAATGLETWLTALIMLLVLLLLAALAVWLAMRRLRQARFIPEETIAAAKEDLEWAQRWTRRA